MRRATLLALLAIWILTTGSTCQATFNSGSGNISGTNAAAGIGIGLFLVGGAIYCIVETEDCFPDEEALAAQAQAYDDAQATFTAGLRRYMGGDSGGLELICLSARQGYSKAQFFYGARLYREGGARQAEGVELLRRAAAQGQREAQMMLRQVAGPAAANSNGVERGAVETPSCVADDADGPDLSDT